MARKGEKRADFKKLTLNLQEFANSLPTSSEKEELGRSLNAIISFLSEIQQTLNAVPSREEAARMHDALQALEKFAKRMESSPAVAAILGVAKLRHSRISPATYSEEEIASAQSLLTEMEGLPIDEMRSRLLDEGTLSLRKLQVLASSLGIKAVQRAGRDALAHQVASKISNYRGYQGLRAGTESS